MGRKRVLILDDEPDFGAFVKRVAEDLGYEATQIDRSTEFKATYAAIEPDRIVLDVVMPEMDGVEIIQWLASVENKAPVVLVTGVYPDYAKMIETLAKVGSHFTVTSLTKPVGLTELQAALGDG